MDDDFNNILGSVILNAELAVERVRFDPVPYKHLTQILKSSHRASELIKQILAFSRYAEEERNL